MAIYMVVSINEGTPQCLVHSGKSHLKVDANWGYPYFRKPPYHLSMMRTFPASLRMPGVSTSPGDGGGFPPAREPLLAATGFDRSFSELL